MIAVSSNANYNTLIGLRNQICYLRCTYKTSLLKIKQSMEVTQMDKIMSYINEICTKAMLNTNVEVYSSCRNTNT
jgi:hypothetical protein